MKRLAVKLASKWHNSYAQTVGWVKVRIQFAIIRAIDLRVRGSRKKVWGLALEDGPGMGFSFEYLVTWFAL